MNAILDVLKRKDEEDYVRLGNIALKVNKVLAISGPTLTTVAAANSALGFCTVSAVAVAIAAAVNTLEHGGQVGMVVEMYKNCAGLSSTASTAGFVTNVLINSITIAGGSITVSGEGTTANSSPSWFAPSLW